MRSLIKTRRKSLNHKPEKTLRTKVCHRCGELYNTYHKYSKICQRCSKTSGYDPTNE